MSLSEAVEAASKAFITDDCIIGEKVKNRALELARDAASSILGCIYDFGTP